MSNYVLILITLVLLLISFSKSKEKTKKALKKAWKAFLNLLKPMVTIILFVGIVLALFNAETISMLIGENSGVFGIGLAALVGSITFIPGFIAFQLAAMLLKAGAGYAQIATFISTLMMVGIITLSLEAKFFNFKMAYKRNICAFIFAVVIGGIMGEVL
jgi:uncharacterized membrane protein YraQ (UPF0718 family)